MHGAVTCIAWHAPDQRAVHDAHYCGVSASENDMYFILFMLVLQGKSHDRISWYLRSLCIRRPSINEPKTAQAHTRSGWQLIFYWLPVHWLHQQIVNLVQGGSKNLMEHPGTRGRIFYFARFYWTNHPRDSGTLLYKVIMMSFYQQRRCLPPRDDWQVSQTQFRGACSSSTHVRWY